MTKATHPNVFAALAAAQMEMGAALKSANNPHFKSKYADLASVIDACGAALNRHGIAYYSVTDSAPDGSWVQRTTLSHGESDTSIHCDVPLIIQKRDMQGFGSACTYARRYGLMALAGIAPEDDDGYAAAKAAPRGDEGVGRKTIPDADFATPEGVVSARKAAPYPAGASPAEKARIAADGIIKEMREAKTPKGLNGVWGRHEGIITRLADSYPVEHGDVLDVFTSLMSQLEDA